MKRTTVSLPDDVARIVEFEAQRRRISVSELVRQSVVSHLKLSDGRPRTIPFIGIGSSGRDDISERIDEILAEEGWGGVRGR
jgi:hypothetical protein